MLNFPHGDGAGSETMHALRSGVLLRLLRLAGCHPRALLRALFAITLGGGAGHRAERGKERERRERGNNVVWDTHHTQKDMRARASADCSYVRTYPATRWWPGVVTTPPRPPRPPNHDYMLQQEKGDSSWPQARRHGVHEWTDTKSHGGRESGLLALAGLLLRGVREEVGPVDAVLQQAGHTTIGGFIPTNELLVARLREKETWRAIERERNMESDMTSHPWHI